MKKIKIKFVDKPFSFLEGSLGDKEEFNVYYEALLKKYQVEISEEPDYIFCYCPLGNASGIEYESYKDCVRCQIAQEAVRPDFNCFDYAIGMFPDFKYEDRYYYLPFSLGGLSKILRDCYDLMQKKHENVGEQLVHRNFCSFVVSNGSNCDKEREEFFNLLSKYKKVASGGRFLNNVGGPVENKLDFEHKHKFSIAFENIWYSHITEKIDMAFAAQTVPIYWGNPKVAEIYNDKAFINCHAYDSFEAVVERIKEIDQNDELYLSMLREPAMLTPKSSEEYINGLADFMEHMIETPKEKAILRSNYAWSKTMNDVRREGFKRIYKKRQRRKKVMRVLRRFFVRWKDTPFARKVKKKMLS